MWRLFADYHTHTLYSHGRGTVRENVDGARRRGLRQVAVTDHGPRLIGAGVLRSERFLRIKEETDHWDARYGDIDVLVGAEANVIDTRGRIDVPRRIVAELDLLLVGLHGLMIPTTLRDGIHLIWNNASGRPLPCARLKARDGAGPSDARARYIRRINTLALTRAVRRYNVDIIVHPGHRHDLDTAVLARACASRGTALEINASHGHMTEDYVRIAAEEGVLFAVGSGAHHPREVGRLGPGAAVARAAGLEEHQVLNAEDRPGDAVDGRGGASQRVLREESPVRERSIYQDSPTLLG